jgi:hypothetical protein
MRVRGLALLLASAVAVSAACGSGAPAREAGPARPTSAQRAAPAERPASAERPAPTGGRPAARDDEVGRLADRLAARARALEPSVSALLGDIAAEVGGRLAGFEHRFKERRSLLRKIRKELHDHPGWEPKDIAIDDALRYTIEVGDSPPGRHARAIRAALARFEAAGHRVARVKNYWPRGDNYSGVNSILVAPDGFSWELQFHTPESYRVKNRDRILYEEMREVETTPARKRQLYREMTAPWDRVPIPQRMLEPKALHPREEIIRRPPP